MTFYSNYHFQLVSVIEDWYDFLYFEFNGLSSLFSWLPVVQLLFVAFFVLILTIFLPIGAQLSQIIYRVLASSLFIVLLGSVYDVVPRFSKKVTNFIWAENETIGVPYFADKLHEHDLGLFKSIDILLEFYSPESSFKTLNGGYILADPLFSHFFLLFSLSIATLFLYSISSGRSVWPSGEVEFPILVLLLVSTSLALLHVERLIDLVILLEIATLGTYVLVGYERINRFSALAGIQYLIIGTLPSAALILAVALIYKGWGGLTFHELDLLTSASEAAVKLPLDSYGLKVYDPKYQFTIVPAWAHIEKDLFERIGIFNYLGTDKTILISLPSDYTTSSSNFFAPSSYSYLSVLAAILVRFNLFFKLTAAPFHFWAPSVYGNAPLASVTFVSILSKAFVLAIRVKLIWTFFHLIRLVRVPLLLLVAVLSVFGGTIGAMVEQYTKRFYVYSSMGHVGFMLAGISFLYLSGLGAQFHYLAIYILTSYAMWFFLMVLGPSATHLVHFSRLKEYPQLGIFLTFLLFSISGLPPLAGFYVKLDIFITLLESSRFYTAYFLYFFSVVSFFYYLRLIKIFFFDGNEIDTQSTWEVLKPKPILWLLAFLTLTILLYGIFVERSLLLSQIEILSSLV